MKSPSSAPAVLFSGLLFSLLSALCFGAFALIGRLTHHVELILFPGGNNRLRESSINSIMPSGKGGN